MKKLILAVIFVLSFNLVVLAQPSNLTDRELLIQLYSKIDSIEIAINRMVDNSGIIQSNVILLDKRVSANEMSISNFYVKLDELVTRWNTLLGLFVAFITGIFIFMWKRVYNGKKANHVG